MLSGMHGRSSPLSLYINFAETKTNWTLLAAQSLDRKIRQKMKKKILLLAATLLLSLSVAETATAQSAVQRKSYVTSSMARKITYFCQYKDLAMAIFADANEIVSGVELDKTINTLDKHLDCAENFFLAIYYRYGMEMGYGVLENMGLTPREIEVVQAEWKKDDERRAAIAEQKRKEKESGYLKLIEENGVFTSEQLAVQPKISIDLTAISMLLPDNPKSKIDYWFYCIISKDGYISLEDANDTLKYANAQKMIYNNFIKGDNAIEVGKVEIDGKRISVNSRVPIHLNEERKRDVRGSHNSELTFRIQKDKRLNSWFVIWGDKFPNRHLLCNDIQCFKSQLTGALYNCRGLENLDIDRYNYIEVMPYQRKLKCNLLADDVEDVYLPHVFEISLLDAGGMKVAKLEYETCLIPENAFVEQDKDYLLRCNKMEKKYQKQPNRFVDVSMKDGDFTYYVSSDGFEYNFASEAYNICLLGKEGVFMLFNEQKFVKRK